MALQKTKTVKGYDANYWRIVQINTNFDRLDVNTTVALYKDEATRYADSGAVIDQKSFLLGDEFAQGNYSNGVDKMKDITLKEAYKALKKLASDEAAKEDDDDTKKNDLAWFSDCSDV